MEPRNAGDAAIGWALIVAISTACFFGIPYLIQLLVRSISAARESERQKRELIQEELDEQLRQEMLAWAQEEHAKEIAREERT
jgi:hypothetical protein